MSLLNEVPRVSKCPSSARVPKCPSSARVPQVPECPNALGVSDFPLSALRVKKVCNIARNLLVNPFALNALFLYPRKISEKLRFSDVFGG